MNACHMNARKIHAWKTKALKWTIAAALTAPFCGLSLLTWSAAASAQTPAPAGAKPAGAAESKPVPAPPAHEPRHDDTWPVRTFFLRYTTSQNDANELLIAVRNIVDPSVRAYLDFNQNAIVLRASPSDQELAERLIRELDRAKKAYRLTYTITELEQDKPLGTQHVSMILVSGQRTTMKLGSKVPVITGSYNPNSAPSGVQTQFQYLDVGVNIDMTPTVHYDREISLKLKIEVSSQNGSVTIQGVTEPIISQRVAEQVIQLKDGEPSLLAGILTNQDTTSVGGTPGLAQLPILKYFFSSQDKQTTSDEIVFLLIPHIVRESILTDQNTRPIYAGTSRAVELIHNANAGNAAQLSTAAPRTPDGGTSAANAAAAMLPQMAAAAQPPSPAAANAAATAPASGPAGSAPLTLSVLTAPQEPVGSTFQVTVQAANARDLFGVPLQLQFDPKVLSLLNVDAGDLLGRDGQAVALVHRDEGNGAVTISATRPPNTPGVNGQGAVCVLTFKAIAPGSSSLALVRIGAKDSHQNSLPAVGTQATVQVSGAGSAPSP